jgi:hypothetical protein
VPTRNETSAAASGLPILERSSVFTPVCTATAMPVKIANKM